MDKQCSKCHRTMSISLFPKSSTGKFGVHSWCKECHREYGRLHKKERYDAVKKYKSSHIEVEKERRKSHYIKNKQKELLYAKEYRSKNAEMVSSRNKKWRLENPDKVKKSVNAWRSNNKDKVVQMVESRRFRKISNGGNYTPFEWKSLCCSFGNRCACCGKESKLTVDHVIPLIKGGTNSIDNIQPLCQSCNSKKGVKILDYRKVVHNYEHS